MSDDFESLLEGDPEQPPPMAKTALVTSAVNAPTVYADGCLFATRLGSTVRLTFAENILEAADGPSPGLKMRHVGTLVLPIEGYQAMMAYLADVTPKYIFPQEETADGE